MEGICNDEYMILDRWLRWNRQEHGDDKGDCRAEQAIQLRQKRKLPSPNINEYKCLGIIYMTIEYS